MKKIVDERHESELMKIERAGFWILFFALVIDLITKVLFFDTPFKYFIGENIVFLIGCVTIIVGCFRKGLWTQYSTPCLKDYLVHSLIGTVIFSLVLLAALYIRKGKLMIGATLVFAVVIFVIMFAVLAILGECTKRRLKKLEDKYADE